jgi:hypothetical protein
MAVNLFDSRFSDRITIFRMLSVDLLVTQKSTEHPHKLPNLIVKELPGILPGKDRPFYRACRLCQELFRLSSSWPAGPSVESAYSTVR